MSRLTQEIIDFDDAGAGDDHPVKGITMGHIRRWFDEVESMEFALRERREGPDMTKDRTNK